MSEPNGVTALESKLEMINKSIQGHESILRCNYTHIDNERIRETVNFLWTQHYWASKALAYELSLSLEAIK